MKATVLDTKTGKTVVEEDVSEWGWSHGNWSCDCNRELMFGNETSEGFCIGCKRYIVIKATGDDGIDYKPSELVSLNTEYPKELLEKHGVK